MEGLTAPNLCGRNEVSENGTERRVDDIFVPKPINQNIYAWYLAVSCACNIQYTIYNVYTVEPPIKDAPNKGHDSEHQKVVL